MTNVIALNVPTRILPQEARISALLGCFSQDRRISDDVFWLKENAELLNILECTGQSVHPETLQLFEGFYQNAEKRLQFFPQYYRFLLSLALDLEDLGLPGDVAQRMVDFAKQQELPLAELSDLQRAEARRLMIRRGVESVRDEGLDDRLRAFAARTHTFSLPNKKAAYELTHISFYLSEYGRRDPKLSIEGKLSLHFAGLTAFLDQNADLLAEICIALRYAGVEPPKIWTEWLKTETVGFIIEDGDHVPLNDDYHAFLVCNWHQAVAGGPVFRMPIPGGRMRFEHHHRATALREISQVMLSLDDARSGDWHVMRNRMAPQLSPEARDVLNIAAESSTEFDAFFEGFARANQRASQGGRLS
ncbi:hypothetical protein J7443_06335 [Tropicibacter sp. R15_0]|uniref:DUF6902 family protein n=1 Tax=Tropicibacter sp. R15_0 TaxID=2821101 RepID=UPI001AD99360|nr:hypothetical protein [Tropicibacter sp. R15_0]MBO9464837.1 hypothetical protein [Tropicibacter sp. R15_0]